MNQEAQALADEIKLTAFHYASSAAVGEPTFDIAVGMEKLIDHLAAMAQPPAGWVMVPVEPTQMMVERACESIDHLGVRWSDMREAYEAALAAAPKPEDTK